MGVCVCACVPGTERSTCQAPQEMGCVLEGDLTLSGCVCTEALSVLSI